MEKKPEQLQFLFDQKLAEIVDDFRSDVPSATLICFQTVRMEQHISKVHRDLMRRGFGLNHDDDAVAG